MERVSLERKVLSENDRIAADLRARFTEHDILCLTSLALPDPAKPACSNVRLTASTAASEPQFSLGTFRRKTTRNDSRGLGFP